MPDKQEVIDSRDRSASPVFVDVTGRRRRRLRRLGYAAAALCGGYSIMIGISLVGGPVTPQTLLPRVGGGDETKVVPTSKHRPPADDGPAALPPPRPSWPVRGTPGSAPPLPRVSGSAPSGAVPSPPASDERRTGPRAPAVTPSRPGGTPPAAPPADPASPSESPPETGEPAAVDERRADVGAESTGAEPQAAAATPLTVESDPTAPAAGAQG
ncbi:hypothetical protein [Actinomadura livida]|uniref:Uncharacterized protein n=1 Tax=Actinomadura livida TaxID=79909 RepID=A0A7W7ID21_9ACTN|nr:MULTISPECIES: hypothetical protein [Actinomadura]MBB4774857.1 hypothetical protein [Actinomadura catellatispora]GGU05573.1 hypothetical protein GCM10010208_32160 [Actinomadura livida]